MTTLRLVSELSPNTDDDDTVYIIDESSMVSDLKSNDDYLSFGSGFLLADFVQFFRDVKGRKPPADHFRGRCRAAAACWYEFVARP